MVVKAFILEVISNSFGTDDNPEPLTSAFNLNEWPMDLIQGHSLYVETYHSQGDECTASLGGTGCHR